MLGLRAKTGRCFIIIIYHISWLSESVPIVIQKVLTLLSGHEKVSEKIF